MCRVFTWWIDEKLVSWNFCVIKGDVSMINALSGLAGDLYSKVADILPVSAVSLVNDGAKY